MLNLGGWDGNLGAPLATDNDGNGTDEFFMFGALDHWTLFHRFGFAGQDVDTYVQRAVPWLVAHSDAVDPNGDGVHDIVIVGTEGEIGVVYGEPDEVHGCFGALGTGYQNPVAMDASDDGRVAISDGTSIRAFALQ